MHKKDYYILLSITETIDKIIRYSSSYNSPEEFYNNQRDFDATMMNFIVLGEVVGKLSNEFKDGQQHINWSKIYGLRNIVAHQYFGINVDAVWQIIQRDLLELKNQIDTIFSK